MSFVCISYIETFNVSCTHAIKNEFAHSIPVVEIEEEKKNFIKHPLNSCK